MKKIISILFILILISVVSYPVLAVDFSYGGQFDSYLERKNNNYNFANDLKLKFDLGSFNYNGHLEGALINQDSKFANLSQFSPDNEVKLDKAYLDFWFASGELKLGKQRIAWGSGYFFNPTDIINPLKEDNKSEINPRQSTDSIFGSYYLGKGALQGVIVTDFQPLGPDNNDQAVEVARSINPALDGSVVLPQDFTDELEYGLRYTTVINYYDFSLMYYQGREDYPVVSAFESNNTPPEVIFSYPEKETFGLDLSGTLAGGEIGVWVEAAYTNPDIGHNYLQSIIGLDYTYQNGLHLLGEYYRDESLSNFIPGQEVKTKDFLGLESDYNLTDLLKITGSLLTPFNSDFYLLNGELNYSMAQNVELKAGFNQPINEEGTIFENNDLFPAEDNLYLELSYYF
jgi:hypothetical protein